MGVFCVTVYNASEYYEMRAFRVFVFRFCCPAILSSADLTRRVAGCDSCESGLQSAERPHFYCTAYLQAYQLYYYVVKKNGSVLCTHSFHTCARPLPCLYHEGHTSEGSRVATPDSHSLYSRIRRQNKPKKRFLRGACPVIPSTADAASARSRSVGAAPRSRDTSPLSTCSYGAG